MCLHCVLESSDKLQPCGNSFTIKPCPWREREVKVLTVEKGWEIMEIGWLDSQQACSHKHIVIKFRSWYYNSFLCNAKYYYFTLILMTFFLFHRTPWRKLLTNEFLSASCKIWACQNNLLISENPMYWGFFFLTAYAVLQIAY